MCSPQLVVLCVFAPTSILQNLQSEEKYKTTRCEWSNRKILFKRLTAQYRLTTASSKSSTKFCMKVKSHCFFCWRLTGSTLNSRPLWPISNEHSVRGYVSILGYVRYVNSKSGSVMWLWLTTKMVRLFFWVNAYLIFTRLKVNLSRTINFQTVRAALWDHPRSDSTSIKT